MEKIKKVLFATFIILFFLSAVIFAKVSYIITLKGGTKIKAESFEKKDDVIKVFKYGGYIIYPLKNIKDIKKIEEPILAGKKLENKSKNKKKNECNPVIKKIESVPVYNKKNNRFDLELKGEIYNGCPKFLKNVYLIISYYAEDNSILFTHKEFLNEIPSYEELKFSKKFHYKDISKIKYFNYKLEFTKD